MKRLGTTLVWWLIVTGLWIRLQAAPANDTPAADPLIKDPAAIALLPPPAEPDAAAELLVELKEGTDGQAFAQRWGLQWVRTLRSDANMVVLKAPSDATAQVRLQGLLADRSVSRAYLNPTVVRVPRAFVPNDPYFTPGNPAGFPGQWHLVNPARPDLDSNVRGAWNRDLTGAGVIIGIADDGVENAHPDLAPNYLAAESWNFVEQNANPNPARADDNHGTAVAGVAAARGGNGIGVTGAAPLAGIAGLRVPLGGGGRLSDFVDVIKFRSFGANRSIKVKNHSYGVSVPFQASDAERDAVAASAAAGTIHVWAAGNERGKSKEDANKDPVGSSPHVLSIAALASSGIFSDYSCFGANVFITAPSNSRRQGEHGQSGAWTGIATTDRSSGAGYNPGPPEWGVNSYPDRAYTGDFGGTSSAAPLVSGIMALAVQANPSMDVRLAKHLLARTGRKIDPNDTSPTSDGGWRTNAAGFAFNPNYGFGLIDADALSRLAAQYTGVTPLTLAEQQQPVTVNAAIPDNGELSRTFTIAATTPLEEVEVYLDITHTFRGDLEAYLTSPKGTRARLFMRNGLNDRFNQGSIDWWFVANAFWGENPDGTWTLTVRDAFAGDTGTWNRFRTRLRMGEAISGGTPTPPTLTGFTPATAAIGATLTLNGTKLGETTAVRFNGVNANFTVVSPTQLTVIVPPGATTGPILVVTPGGSVTSATAFQVLPGPALTGFEPGRGSAGTRVLLTGANLTGTTAVAFAGVNATFTVLSPTEVEAIVPATATTGRITLTTPTGTTTSSGSFTITAAPVLASFHPTSGGPGMVVTLQGANFTGTTAVSFNGVPAASFNVSSPDRLLATVPATATSGPITVVTPNGTVTSIATFNVVPPPLIASFLPTSGAPGLSVSVDGQHFIGVERVEFNGVATAGFTVESPTRLTATVPVAATTGPVRVITTSGTATSATAFTVLSGTANDAFALPLTLTGPSGTVRGSNLGATREAGEPAHANNPGGRSVWFVWQAPAEGPYVFDTFGTAFDTVLGVYRGDALSGLIEVAASDDAAGTPQSSVTFLATTGTTYRIAVDGFNADPANPANASAGEWQLNWARVLTAPVITSFQPIRGTTGTIVTVEGSGFAATTGVQFGDIAATSFTVTATNRLTAVVPAGATTGSIRILSPAGNATSATVFTVDTGPANDHLAQAQILTGADGQIAGSNVGATLELGERPHAGHVGARSVWFAWTAPAAGTWSFDTAGSSFDTLLAVYTGTVMEQLVTVADNDDAEGLPNRASRVTFTAAAGTRYLLAVDGYVGATGDLVLRWSATPNAPAINQFSPMEGFAGIPVTLTGVNFTGSTQVLFNQVPAEFTVNGPSQITATVPPGAATGPIRVVTPNGTATSDAAFVLAAGPSNDAFVAAVILVDSASVVAGANTGASLEAGEPAHGEAPGGRSIWFRWIAPSAGRWDLDTAGSGFDTTLGVYTGNTVATLTQVTANDDAPGVLTSAVSFQATAGTTYHIAVDGYDGEHGPVVLRLLPASPEQVLFETGFEAAEGYQVNSPLAGQQGWLLDGSGGNGIVEEYFAGRGQQAFVGFTPPEQFGDSLFVWQPINHTPNTATAPVIRFSVLMMIVDSSNGVYDDFGWSFFNTDGRFLFSLDFDNSDLGIYYFLDGANDYVWTGVDFDNDLLHELTVLIDFANHQWTAFIDGIVLVEDAPLTTTGLREDLGDVDAYWSPRNDAFPGNNYLLFDDYRITAEGSQVPAIVLQPKSQTANSGDQVTLSVGARGGDPVAYQWRFNNQDLPGATRPVLTLRNLDPSQTGDYTVAVVNPFGSIQSDTARLTVVPNLPLNLVPSLRQADQALVLTLSGTAGQRIELESSPDLRTWNVRGTFTLPTGSVEFIETEPSPLGHQFYRTRQAP
jgi:subtilisin-like proprotein convertase family protein